MRKRKAPQKHPTGSIVAERAERAAERAMVQIREVFSYASAATQEEVLYKLLARDKIAELGFPPESSLGIIIENALASDAAKVQKLALRLRNTAHLKAALAEIELERMDIDSLRIIVERDLADGGKMEKLLDRFLETRPREGLLLAEALHEKQKIPTAHLATYATNALDNDDSRACHIACVILKTLKSKTSIFPHMYSAFLNADGINPDIVPEAPALATEAFTDEEESLREFSRIIGKAAGFKGQDEKLDSELDPALKSAVSALHAAADRQIGPLIRRLEP